MEDSVCLNVVMVKLSMELKHVMMEIKGQVMVALLHVRLNQTINVLDNLQSVQVLHQPHQHQLLLTVEMVRLTQMKIVMMETHKMEMDVLVLVKLKMGIHVIKVLLQYVQEQLQT